VDDDQQFTGKYESEGRAGAWLLQQFYDGVRDLLGPVLPSAASVLEVGCGAGYSTGILRDCLAPGTAFIASDVGTTLVRKTMKRNPGVDLVQQSVYELALPDQAVDVVIMLEVLEHLEEPRRALAELRRVARRHVVLSTPREPIWRFLNFCRGKYVRALGNTPGHIQHWSSAGLQREVAPYFKVVGVRQPLPWTILLLESA
jgi:ubiquinone/menaquinone biosynthesis C-methylase UbiE